MTRYIIGFLLAIGLIVVVIILIIRGFSGSAPQQPLDLNNYADTDTAVQLTIDSPIAVSPSHHDIIINVNNTETTFTITQGYVGHIDTQHIYPMNVNAYTSFLASLMLNGFTLGNNNPSLSSDQGHCAVGDRYIYQVINGNGNNLQRYWYTSCSTGTFEGNVPIIQQLFEAQIPNYYNLTSNITL